MVQFIGFFNFKKNILGTSLTSCGVVPQRFGQKASIRGVIEPRPSTTRKARKSKFRYYRMPDSRVKDWRAHGYQR